MFFGHKITVSSKFCQKNPALAKQNRVEAEIEYYVPCTDDHSEAYRVKGVYVTVTGTLFTGISFLLEYV